MSKLLLFICLLPYFIYLPLTLFVYFRLHVSSKMVFRFIYSDTYKSAHVIIVFLLPISLLKTYAPVICNHCPPPTGRVGDSWAEVQGNYFSSVLSVQGKRQGFDIKILNPGRFSIAKGGANSKVLTSSLPPSRALKAEKS